MIAVTRLTVIILVITLFLISCKDKQILNLEKSDLFLSEDGFIIELIDSSLILSKNGLSIESNYVSDNKISFMYFDKSIIWCEYEYFNDSLILRSTDSLFYRYCSKNILRFKNFASKLGKLKVDSVQVDIINHKSYMLTLDSIALSDVLIQRDLFLIYDQHINQYNFGQGHEVHYILYGYDYILKRIYTGEAASLLKLPSYINEKGVVLDKK